MTLTGDNSSSEVIVARGINIKEELQNIKKCLEENKSKLESLSRSFEMSAELPPADSSLNLSSQRPNEILARKNRETSNQIGQRKCGDNESSSSRSPAEESKSETEQSSQQIVEKKFPSEVTEVPIDKGKAQKKKLISTVPDALVDSSDQSFSQYQKSVQPEMKLGALSKKITNHFK